MYVRTKHVVLYVHMYKQYLLCMFIHVRASVHACMYTFVEVSNCYTEVHVRTCTLNMNTLPEMRCCGLYFDTDSLSSGN